MRLQTTDAFPPLFTQLEAAPNSIALPGELSVVLFCGWGGACQGLEAAMGRPPTYAINHSDMAIAMHSANHPDTIHLKSDVFDVDPMKLTGGRDRIGVAWFSPDCTQFSRAKGGKPVSRNLRSLAWVVLKYTGLPAHLKPRIFFLENVREFLDWGPLGEDDRPIKARAGETFREWVAAIEADGYTVEWRLLKACDYGAPTTRLRLFMVARCDGQPIVWPEPTHGPADSPEVQRGELLPYRSAAECIDWNDLGHSIFTPGRNLKPTSMRRIARGIQRFVLEAADPFIVTLNHGGEGFRGQGLHEPMRTITAAHDAHGLAVPFLRAYYGEAEGQFVRGQQVSRPLDTVTPRNRFALAMPLLAKFYGQTYTGAGVDVRTPFHAVTTKDHHRLVAAHVLEYFGQSYAADAARPLHGLTTRDRYGVVGSDLSPDLTDAELSRAREAYALLAEHTPDALTPEMHAAQLVLVTLEGQTYVLADITMRMLTPAELARAQSFRPDTVLDRTPDGRKVSKEAQVHGLGNAVCPVVAQALATANLTLQEAAD